jgi:cytoplasmic iron level regulating protein YaaA (DUF328/UPF0246 family)
MRELIIQELEKVSRDEAAAMRVLKLGKRNLHEAKANLEIHTSPTMPALARYTGVLFEALGYESLSEVALKRAKEQLFIQSALFGLLPATEHIPFYRLSATSALPGISLRKLWSEAHNELVWPRLSGPIMDMRSKAYVELAPIPKSIESYQVDVLDERSGKALNHFNKKAKGAFTRAALEGGLSKIEDVALVAENAGLKSEFETGTIRLIVPAGF